MKDAICFTRLLKECGWRVQMTADGPTLKKTVEGAILPAGMKKQLTVLKQDLVKLHTEHTCDVLTRTCEQAPTPCGAAVYDGVQLADANNEGVGLGCPYAHCPYRG